MITQWKFFGFLTALSLVFALCLGPHTARAEGEAKNQTKDQDGPVGLSVIKMKTKGSWTEVTIAIENRTNRDLEFPCCNTYLETDNGFAVASLDRGEVQTQIHNKARTGAIIGEIIGVGLGIGGLASGHDELAYAGLGVGAGSAIAGTAGGAVAEGAERRIVIDDIMRNQIFPSGLKVAGVVYFPPKSKWPGSKHAQAVHLAYNLKGKSYKVSAPIH